MPSPRMFPIIAASEPKSVNVALIASLIPTLVSGAFGELGENYGGMATVAIISGLIGLGVVAWGAVAGFLAVAVVDALHGS